MFIRLATGIGSDHSANWTTTTIQFYLTFGLCEWIRENPKEVKPVENETTKRRAFFHSFWWVKSCIALNWFLPFNRGPLCLKILILDHLGKSWWAFVVAGRQLPSISAFRIFRSNRVVQISSKQQESVEFQVSKRQSWVPVWPDDGIKVAQFPQKIAIK